MAERQFKITKKVEFKTKGTFSYRKTKLTFIYGDLITRTKIKFLLGKNKKCKKQIKTIRVKV